jgi:hypothetical protein
MYARAGHPEIKSDEIAWCSAALNTWMLESNIRGTGSLAARSWLTFGRAVDIRKVIPRGAVLIFRRGNSSWQGHVCLCLEDRDGTLMRSVAIRDGVTIDRYRKTARRRPLADTVGNSRTISAGRIGPCRNRRRAQGSGRACRANAGSPRPWRSSAAGHRARSIRIAQYLLIALAVAGLSMRSTGSSGAPEAAAGSGRRGSLHRRGSRGGERKAGRGAQQQAEGAMIGLSGLFRALSLKLRILIVGGGIAAIAVGYGLWHHKVFNSGWNAAIAAMPRRIGNRCGSLARANWRACIDDGGVWNASTGHCRRR